MSIVVSSKRIFAASVFVLASHPALALDEIYSPNVEYRELSLEYNGSRTFDTHAEKNDAQEHELVFEAGLTPFWEIETSGGFTKDPGSHVQLDDLEIENRFQFSKIGENWIDSGLLVAYDFSMHGHQPDTLETKLLLQKDIGKITNTANIGFEQNIGRSAPAGGPDYVALWNTRYRFNEYVQPGIEIQNDLGQAHSLGHFSQQQAYIGPAVYGRLFNRFKYQAGYFIGASGVAAQSAARVLVEYEMHF